MRTLPCLQSGRRLWPRLLAFVLAIAPVHGTDVAIAHPKASPIDGAAILREAWQVADERYFDPAFNGVDWPAVLKRYEPQAAAASTPRELSNVINAMLAELRTSHIGCFTVHDREYYELLDIFNRGGAVSERIGQLFPGGEVSYESIGVVTREIEGKVFITDVIPGMPAFKAGLRSGDEVVSADGRPFEPIDGFRGKSGETVRLVVQSTTDPTSRREIEVAPARVVPHEMFLSSIEAGARVIEHEGRRIAYVRIRSYASEKYQEALVRLTTGDGPLAQADALVLDIRGGWGGANPDYLDFFSKTPPAMTYAGRDGRWRSNDDHWRKPVVLLIDHGSRSGKEILAYGFKDRGIGPIVGQRTAGAVVGGGPFLLSDGSFVLMAVSDVLVEGKRLEGVGVEPDIAVEFDPRYAAGADPQLDRAVQEASRLGGGSSTNVR